MTHPAAEELAAYARGKLAESDAQHISRHLSACVECQKIVEAARTGPRQLSQSARSPIDPSANSAAAASPAATLPDLPPDLANHPKFKVVKTLGQGGMGTVYQAEHRVMERQVAIKVINQSLVEHPEALQRFFAEVRGAAKLQHPNIVAAYDAEQAGSLHLLVMEYVEGVDLASYVEPEGPLPVEHACNFIRQAALGLQHAFEQGMVHRDIKPQNLMLTRKGQVKILDFGLARLASERTKGKGLTQVGAFLGTPEYVAPEQATDASTADIRADIYSLGCTLYFLLTGRPPFEEDTAVKMVLAHLEKTPTSLAKVRPEVPVELADVVARMLAKDPAQRYQTPVEVIQALTPFCKPGQKTAMRAVAAPSAISSGQKTAIPADTSRLPRRKQTLAQEPELLRKAEEPTAKRSPPARLLRRWPSAWPWVAAGIAILALIVTLGSIIYVKTNKGTIKIELSDSSAAVEIKVDGDTVSIDGLDEPLRLKAGDHELIVTGKNFQTATKSFTVKRGDNPVLHITIPEKQTPVASNRSESGKQATQNVAPRTEPGDRWISIMPTEDQVSRTSFAKFENGVLRLQVDQAAINSGRSQAAFNSGKDQARNAIIRVVVKKLAGHNVFLNLREKQGETYGATFSGDQFGIGKNVHVYGKDEWTQLARSRATKPYRDFFEMAFKAEDDLLTLEVDGVEVVRARDTTHNRAGVLTFGTFQGQGLFKKAEIKILDGAARKVDEPPTPENKATAEKPLPRNRWIALDPSEGNVSGEARSNNGVLTCNPGPDQGGFVGFHSIRAKNMTIRAQVKRPDKKGGHLDLALRDNGKQGAYQAVFYTWDDGKGYTIGIIKAYEDDQGFHWEALRNVANPIPGLVVDDFFEMAFSAVGDHLFVTVNGKRAVEVHDSSFQEGAPVLWSWECRAVFKDIEVKIHDD
jgi:serine/threonine protein kinase